MDEAPQLSEQDEMPRRKGVPKSKQVKLTEKVHDACTKAAGFAGVSIADYVNKVLLVAATETIETGYREWKAGLTQADQGSPDDSA